MSTEQGRKSLGSISQRGVRDEYAVSSPIESVSPALRRRSRAPTSPSLSPVFARKAILCGRNRDAAAGGVAGRKAWLAFENGSPVLGRRNLQQRVAGVGNPSLATDDSPRPLPLRERKNIVGAGRASSKSSAKKTSVAPDTMSKENVQPVRKSARTKKLPERFIASKLCGEGTLAKKNKSPDTRGVDLQTDFDGANVKGKSNKLQKSDSSKKGIPSPREDEESIDVAVSKSGTETQPLEPAGGSSRESQGNITRRKPRLSPPEGRDACPKTTDTFSDFAVPKNTAGVSAKARGAKQKGQNSTLKGGGSSKEKEDPKSRTAVEGGIAGGSSVPPKPSERSVAANPKPSERSVAANPKPSERSVAANPKPSERSVAATPHLSKRETLRQMILNGTLPIRGTAKERGPLGMKSNSKKLLNSTGTYLSSKSYARRQKSAPKKQESADVLPKETTVRAGRSKDSKRNRPASNAVTVQDETCNDGGKENTSPKEIAKVAGKRQRKCRTKATVTETPSGSSSNATPSPRSRSNPGRQDPGSGNLGLAKKKPPVWVAESGSGAVGRRSSIRRKSNLYDFSASPVKDGTKRPKKQQRPRVRTKDPKQKCKLKSVLVTDPQWKNPLVGSSSSLAGSESARSGAGSESTRSVAAAERIFDEEFYARMNSAASEDYGSDGDDVYERDEGNVFEMFVGETASSFIPSQGEESSAVPMVSASGHPTPAYRKQLDKYLGSSTPRVETQSFVSPPKQPATVEDDIAECFGFENDGEDDEFDDGTSLNLSPVRQSGHQSHLNMTINSDIMTSINHSTASQPYRFSWGPMRPGNFSYSSSRSSSMVVHGRSKNRSASSSLSYVSASSFQSSTSRPQVTVRARGRPRLVAKRRSRETPKAGAIAEGTQDVSVLFDEEEEDGKEAEVKKASPVKDGKEAEVKKASLVKQSSGDIRSYLSRNLGSESEKSVNKSQRRSYDRRALIEAKKKFEKEFGGAGTTEAETEEDMSMQSESPKRKKKNSGRKKQAKKPKVANSHDDTTEGSQSSENAAGSGIQPKKRRATKKKTKGNGLDKSIHDWASGVNSHFSEIEDCELVVV